MWINNQRDTVISLIIGNLKFLNYAIVLTIVIAKTRNIGNRIAELLEKHLLVVAKKIIFRLKIWGEIKKFLTRHVKDRCEDESVFSDCESDHGGEDKNCDILNVRKKVIYLIRNLSIACFRLLDYEADIWKINYSN